MRALKFLADHVTFKLPYNQTYQMKTPNKHLCDRKSVAFKVEMI